MNDGRIPIEQLDRLIDDITMAYDGRVEAEAKAGESEGWKWWQRRDQLIQDVQGLYENQEGVAPFLAYLLDTVLTIDVLSYAFQVQDLQSDLEAERDRATRLETEAIALRKEIAQLKAALARQPQTVAVDIPAQRIVVRSALQQEIVRLMGTEGLGRSWRIIERVADAGLGQENSIRNALRKLTKQRVIDDCRRQGKAVHWKVTAGGNRRLVQLTELGRVWYREAFEQEAVESEVMEMVLKEEEVAK